MPASGDNASPRILVAPLDWGLGHATRCIPVIRCLMENNCTVILAGDGKIKALLQREFPQLLFLDLKGYHIRYSPGAALLPLVIAQQVPKILRAIGYERGWLKQMVAKHRIDGIISDNRYGLHHHVVPSIFITHQLRIKGPAWLESVLQKLNYRYIGRFAECWVPDHSGANNLAGDLSHPDKMPRIPVRYIGPLSRFKKDTRGLPGKQLLILLSGPEPQRTILEELMLEQLKTYMGPTVLVRGLPGEKSTPGPGSNIRVFNHLPAAELEETLVQSAWVIARCGYSTVMDLMTLKKKCILIPTPGQTEQEYLAAYLLKKGLALCIPQKKFNLENILDLAATFNYNMGNFEAGKELSIAVEYLVQKLRNKINK